MTYCYLGLGSNLGCPKRNLQKAIRELRTLPRSCIHQVSSIYRSKPYGPKAQPNFYNMVIAIATQLSPSELLRYCKNIEHYMGRVHKKRWGARIIDIDVLIYGNLIFKNATLTLPHPGIRHRDFVLVPLLEIAPHVVIPGVADPSIHLFQCAKNIM